MSRTIIFDFDGTIADTLDSVVKIVNSHAEHFGYKKVTKEDIPYLQGKKPKEILSYLDERTKNNFYASLKIYSKNKKKEKKRHNAHNEMK